MLSTEQWKQVEAELSYLPGRVSLRADGYHVDARVIQMGRRVCILVWVDGRGDGEWMQGAAEQPRKFWFERKRFLHSKAERDDAAKQARKRGTSQLWKAYLQKIVTRTYSMWTPEWGSPRSFTRHLRRSCQHVELVSLGYCTER
ncbi:hypothetical protein [Parachitinimonas caeni]|uniref:Transposase n=1 Tax=Parachitinimonas caeni TaxID=3031301 RepID=A0ABT7E0N6_9NEIS|nr:hypothetical protein [Parachitinimonas caeni]MDK2124467.1 hypothetical protein [Parachitinimonas caeni]